MGGKSAFQRNKGFLYVTGCLILMLIAAGCQYNYYPKVTIENNKGLKGREYLASASEYAANGDFGKAFEENAHAYDAFPAELKQAAIFQKALLHSHPDNPARNYEKAMVCFELVDNEPKDVIFQFNSELIFSSLKGNCGLAKKVTQSQRSVRESQRIIEKRKNQIQSLLEEQKKLKKYIARLRQQIKQLKEVDLSSRGKIKGPVNE